DLDSNDPAGVEVLDEDVGEAVGVPLDEVGGFGEEDDVAAVAGEAGVLAVAGCELAVGPEAEAAGAARLAVVDVELAEAVGRGFEEPCRAAHEGDVAAVRGDGRLRAVAVSALAPAA